MKVTVRRLLFVPGVLVVALALGGCSMSLESVPLPSQVKGPSYELKAQFRNALNLPQGAPVKLRGESRSASLSQFVREL